MSSDPRPVRKVLVDNHEDDYEVEAGDTGNDLLILTAVCCVPVTVQVAMLLNVPSLANQLPSFDQVGICLIEMLIGFVTQSQRVRQRSSNSFRFVASPTPLLPTSSSKPFLLALFWKNMQQFFFSNCLVFVHYVPQAVHNNER